MQSNIGPKDAIVGSDAARVAADGSVASADRNRRETGSMTSSGRSSAFAGFRFPREVIAVAVRWYLRYGLSYRDVEELLAERGRLSARAVGHLLDELAADAGLVDDTEKPDVAPHDIRHTFGTNLVRDGTDIVTSPS
jgi:Phage integrase family